MWATCKCALCEHSLLYDFSNLLFYIYSVMKPLPTCRRGQAVRQVACLAHRADIAQAAEAGQEAGGCRGSERCSPHQREMHSARASLLLGSRLGSMLWDVVSDGSRGVQSLMRLSAVQDAGLQWCRMHSLTEILKEYSCV